MTQQADWDIVTGIGMTALAVAAARALESRRDDRLVSDPFAEAFVRAAPSPTPIPTRFEDIDEDDEDKVMWAAMADYVGVRSRFFDTVLTDAGRAGVRQVVILAAGLDARAYRLDWAPGTVVYELDRAKVLEFKDSVLAGTEPRCHRRTVAVDLRDDWPAALREAGFDASVPTAWIAEGLLPYLPDDATAALFARIDELSAPGGWVAVEHAEGNLAESDEMPSMRRMSWRLGVDLGDLWPDDQTVDPVEWLERHGWTVTAATPPALAVSYGRPFGPAEPHMLQKMLLIAAEAPVSK